MHQFSDKMQIFYRKPVRLNKAANNLLNLKLYLVRLVLKLRLYPYPEKQLRQLRHRQLNQFEELQVVDE